MSDKANPAAFETGRLAEALGMGCYAHRAIMMLVRDPRADQIVPPIVPGHGGSTGFLERLDKTGHTFAYRHFLEKARDDPLISTEMQRAWFVGALLQLGDALGTQRYFDHAPELELAYHLRNAVAHGNAFKKVNKKRLLRYPAHNRLAHVKSDKKTVFEIHPEIAGHPVLFDFIGPADIVDLLFSVGVYLIRMGNGEPLRP